MIDFHAHILPGIDDGARTMEESMKIVQTAAAHGVKAIVATPHILETPTESLRKKIKRAILDLRQAISSAEIDCKIIAGAEFFVSPELPREVKAFKELTINCRGKYILIEFPLQEMPPFTENIIFEFLVRGLTPIMAHPERYLEIQKKPDRLFDWVEKGVLTQVNAGSLLGHYGRAVKKTAKSLLKKKLVHIIGSDLHSASKGDYPLLRGVQKAAQIVGIKKANEMVTTAPRKIILGNHPPK